MLFVLACIVASLAQPPWLPTVLVARAEEQKDQDLMQGTWKVVKLEHDGKVNTKNFLGGTWLIKGKELTA